MQISPAAAPVADLHGGALDDSVDVSSQILALQVHTQRLSGNEKGCKNQLTVAAELIFTEQRYFFFPD